MRATIMTTRAEHPGMRLAKTLAVVALGLALAGCGDSLGQCTVVCTFVSDGSKSYHGPYDDYTEEECDDQAEQSEAPSITTCEADFEPY